MIQRDRERERRIRQFYGTYLKRVFQGGRKWWETTAFYLAAGAAFAPQLWPAAALWLRSQLGDFSFTLETVPAYLVISILIVRAVLAPAWINADLAKKIEDAQKIGWVVQFPGGIDDVSVNGQPNKERYAVANDLVITNHSLTNGISLSAELEIQYGVTTLVREAYGIPVESWSGFLKAFGMTSKQQLLFPLNIGPQSSVEGHIVFSIHPNGAGTGIGGDVLEKREYRIVLTDRLSGQKQLATVTSVVAPKLHNPQGCSLTDLAFAGPREDAWTRT